MNEIFRFLQVRPSQKLTGEEKKLVGLSLFQNEIFSELAEKLKDAGCDKDEYQRIIDEFINASVFIEELSSIHPLVLKFYNWFDYKSKPIHLEEFKRFFEVEIGKDLRAFSEFSLKDEWQRFANSYIVAIHQGVSNTPSTIDYQLLIKVCHILYQFKDFVLYFKTPKTERDDLESNGNLFKFPCHSSTGEFDFINYILNLPILLPPNIFNHRCCEKEEDITPDYTDCKCDEKDNKTSSEHCICIKPYIADLLVIKEELSRYEEGDIAYIENILAGEVKVREHRNLAVSESITESETEVTTSEERDFQVSEQFSLQEQTAKTIQANLAIDAGVTATSKYGPNTSITAHANVAGNYSKSKSNAVAKSYARDVIDRSVFKIQESARKFQSNRILNEIEEKNSHSINNKKGDHRAGIYYWVNKVTKAQVFNYGKHMMFDIYVPEPAALYKKLYQLNVESNESTPVNSEPEPIKPNISPSAITRSNYGALLNQHGIAGGEAPPDEKTSIQISFEHHADEDDDKKINGFSKNIKSEKIPEGYKGDLALYNIRCSTGHPKGTSVKDEATVLVNIGNWNIFYRSFNEQISSGQSVKNWNEQGNKNLTGVEGVVSVSLAGFTTIGMAITGSIRIECTLKADAFEEWQLKIYNLIMNDYLQKKANFETPPPPTNEFVQIKGRNPFLNREIERNELKRHIISILMCNYFKGIGSMLYNAGECEYPEINFQKLEKDMPIIQFFEQVFEWNYLTYLFYHSMWARKCKWGELFEEDSGDPLFDKFLTAGASRVQVPVREGMEEIFSWFLKTGKIWGLAGEPPIYGDDEYVSMIQEIKESRQGDYSERNGEIKGTENPYVVELTNSLFYWDILGNHQNTLNINNDIDREILIDFEVYRIVKIEQIAPSDNSKWNITLDKPFEGKAGNSYKHSVGALYVGSPWEVRIPSKLVYLRNKNDQLPKYPLSKL